MVIVIPDSSGQVDFIVLTSINYALARVGGPVVEYSQTLNLKGETKICFCGHGGIGTIENQPAKPFARHLADPAWGCKDTLDTLLFTCCYAGRRENSDATVGTAVIDIFAKKLQINGLRIRGAMGPSIKSNKLGEAFRVVNMPDPNTAVVGTSGKTPLAIQQERLRKTGKAKLADTHTGDKRKMAWATIKEKIDAGETRRGKPYIQYKAKKYEDLSGGFFKKFATDLDKDNLLLDAGHAMRTVYWDGAKIVTAPEVVTAPAKTTKCCYITTATVRALGLPDDCPELTCLRRFRDQVLLPTAAGRRAVAAYYEVAPRVVAAVDRLPDAAAVYRSFFGRHIAPAVAAVRAGRHGEAYMIYRQLVGETRDRFLGTGEGG